MLRLLNYIIETIQLSGGCKYFPREPPCSSSLLSTLVT